MKGKDQINSFELILSNPTKGLEELYERYGKKLFGYGIRSWNVDEDDCWEIVYKTLYQVVEKCHSYSFPSEKKFGSFIFTVFCNFLRRNYRTKQRIEEQLSFSSFNELNFEGAGGDISMGTEKKVMNQIKEQSLEAYRDEMKGKDIRMQILEDCLDELDDWQRILVLSRTQNMPYKEIADFVQRPEKQLKVYYQRIVTKLTKMVNKKYDAIEKKLLERKDEN